MSCQHFLKIYLFLVLQSHQLFTLSACSILSVRSFMQLSAVRIEFLAFGVQILAFIFQPSAFSIHLQTYFFHFSAFQFLTIDLQHLVLSTELSKFSFQVLSCSICLQSLPILLFNLTGSLSCFYHSAFSIYHLLFRNKPSAFTQPSDFSSQLSLLRIEQLPLLAFSFHCSCLTS